MPCIFLSFLVRIAIVHRQKKIKNRPRGLYRRVYELRAGIYSQGIYMLTGHMYIYIYIYVPCAQAIYGYICNRAYVYMPCAQGGF